MDDDKVTIELSREEARLIAHGSGLVGPFHVVAEQCRAALLPEHPEGTLAWVTAGTGHARHLACLEDGKWWVCGKRHTGLSPIHRVEPLRILGDDEIAIKRPPSSLQHVWRSNAEHARDCPRSHAGAAAACDLIADALERSDG